MINWTKVEEGLPPVGEAVLIRRLNARPAVCSGCLRAKSTHGSNWVGWNNFEFIAFNVTHWAPMPEFENAE